MDDGRVTARSGPAGHSSRPAAMLKIGVSCPVRPTSETSGRHAAARTGYRHLAGGKPPCTQRRASPAAWERICIAQKGAMGLAAPLQGHLQ